MGPHDDEVRVPGARGPDMQSAGTPWTIVDVIFTPAARAFFTSRSISCRAHLVPEAVTLTVEGVYDYFCLPHEAAGMMGRIVVGRPGGPGALPFDYFAGRPATQTWIPVPEAARAAFPSVAAIVADGAVRRR